MSGRFLAKFVCTAWIAAGLFLAVAPDVAARTSPKAPGRAHGCSASPALSPVPAPPKPPGLEQAAEPSEAEVERPLSHGLWQHLLGSEPPAPSKKEKTAPKRRLSPSDASVEDGVTT